ncbi:MAG: hypothetical protein ACYC6W_11105 [Nitrosotalea sp.]
MNEISCNLGFKQIQLIRLDNLTISEKKSFIKYGLLGRLADELMIDVIDELLEKNPEILEIPYNYKLNVILQYSHDIYEFDENKHLKDKK